MTEFGYRTDIGRKRTCNEDALLVLPKYGVFAVADGVGGHGGGDVASRRAISGIEDYVRSNPIIAALSEGGASETNWFKTYFARCLSKINGDLLSIQARVPETGGMATTLVLLYIGETGVHIANIGDSRAYLISDGGILQLTEDHTYVRNLVEAGLIDKDEADEHPRRNEITKALGAARSVEPDYYEAPINKGDKILLCTDGLYGPLTEERLRELSASLPPGEACKRLVKEANEKSGDDNITVVIVEI